MGGKRVAKDYMTHDEFMQQCKGKTPEEVSKLETAFWKSHGINPEVDFYPPEEAAKRFNTVLRACLMLPPAGAEEAALRQQINKDWDRTPQEKPE